MHAGSTTEELEQEFEPLRGTHNTGELAALDAKKDDKRRGYYGHDLCAAIRRGQHRKRAEALDSASRWQTQLIDSRDPNKVTYHLICELVRRCQDAGGSDDEIVRHLNVVAKHVERRANN